MATALVYGWYGRGNAGDELMKQAIVAMFRPRGFELSFVDKIDVSQLLNFDKSEGYVDAVIFGGGSILYGGPNVTPEAMNLLVAGKVPVFYVGVGVETEVHPMHKLLMSIAKVIAARERDIPDLVFSLPVPDENFENPQGLLVIPNIECVPTYDCAHWKHVAWEHYKNEFAQVLDLIMDNGSNVSFLLMCANKQMEDAWAASELIARLKRRPKNRPVYMGVGTEIMTIMKAHKAVVTQRYHGIILAEAAGVPYVSIDHHDKLKNVQPSRGIHLPYYGAIKATMLSSIETAMNSSLTPYQAPLRVYDDLADKIVEIARRNK